MGLIRFLLAMSVVAAHSSPILGLTFVGGKLAVQSFFVISGFYISLILNEKYPTGMRGTLLFYGNRFLRIYPIYWAVLLLTAGAGAAVLLFGLHSIVGYIWSVYKDFSADKVAFLIASNVGILGIDLSSFMRFDLPHLAFTANWTAYKPQPSHLYLVPQAWSLSIEILVYAIAPFLFRRSIGFLVTVLVVSFAARTYAYDAGFNFDPWDYRFFPVRAWLVHRRLAFLPRISPDPGLLHSFDRMGIADDQRGRYRALSSAASDCSSNPWLFRHRGDFPCRFFALRSRCLCSLKKLAHRSLAWRAFLPHLPSPSLRHHGLQRAIRMGRN